MQLLVSDSAGDAARIHWLIRLRWVAVAGVAGVVLFTGPLFHLVEDPLPLLILSGAFTAWNLALQIQERRCRRTASATTQVAVDLGFLTLLLLFSGGLRNPFSVFLVVQVILGAMLLPARQSMGIGILAGLATLGLVGLEVAGVIPMGRLPTGVVPAGNRPQLTLWALSSALLITMGVALHFTQTIMDDLRTRALEAESGRLQLQRAEKLAALGRLSTGIAHEIATPLGTVEILASEAQELLAEDAAGHAPRVIEDMGDVRQEVARVSSLVRQLLDLGHPADGEPAEVDVAELAREAIGIVSHHLDPGREAVRTHFEARLPSAFVPRDRLRQVVINLLSNALDATEGGGGVRVSVRRDGVGFLLMEVADEGEGIREEDLERVFDPFFTTKDVGQGTGLGLYVSYEIMKNLGGEIAIRSAPGRGCAVRIRIPAPGPERS